MVFHSGSKYDYYFLIKQLTGVFEGQFNCLGENSEKYITFSVPIENEFENDKTVKYKTRVIIA